MLNESVSISISMSVSGSVSVYCWISFTITKCSQCEKFQVFIELQNANAIYSSEYFSGLREHLCNIRESFTAKPLKYTD